MDMLQTRNMCLSRFQHPGQMHATLPTPSFASFDTTKKKASAELLILRMWLVELRPTRIARWRVRTTCATPWPYQACGCAAEEGIQEPIPSQPGATRHHLPRKCAVPRKCDPLSNVLQCRALQAPRAATVVALGTQDYSRACACHMDGPQPASAPAAPSCLQATGARASRCERIVVDLPAYNHFALSMSLRCFCEASALL